MNRLGRHIICGLLACMLLVGSALTSYAKPEWPKDTGIQSETGIVVDFDSDTVLFGQGIHERKAPASITKILTALVVIENADLDEEVTYSHAAVYDVEGGSGNKLNIEEGDKLTVRECLYLLLLQSSNQTANALAEHVGGSMEGFVDMMNAKIAELGCEDSHFANPSGLNSDEQYVSAYDMAKIAKAAYSNETLLEINSTRSYKISPTINNPGGPTVKMEHKLLITEDPASENYYPLAVAGKTGYTKAAGQTLVTYAVNGDRRLISVTLRSTQTTHYSDTIALLNFGFTEFANYKIADYDDLLAGSKVDIGGTAYKTSDLSWDPNAVITLPNGAEYPDAERIIVTDLGDDVPDGLVAEVKYTYNDRVIGRNYIYSESKRASDAAARAQKAAESEAEEARLKAEAESREAASKEAEKAPKEAFKLPELNLTKEQMVTYGCGTAAGLVLAALILFLVLKKRREEALAAARQQRRRERLAEMGCSEEEFQRMVDERREVVAERNEALAEAVAANAETVNEVISASGMDVEDLDMDQEEEAAEVLIEETEIGEADVEEDEIEEAVPEETDTEEAVIKEAVPEEADVEEAETEDDILLEEDVTSEEAENV